MVLLRPTPPSHPDLPRALAGFEHIKRYWDPSRKLSVAKLLPGEYYISMHGEMITTVLGSCISACIRDRKLGIGGMNHFMLPHSADIKDWGGTSSSARYGSYAMEKLINEILKAGGKRENLEVKAFGGGSMASGVSSVGRKNIAFLHQFLQIEGLRLISEDLGSMYPRKVNFFPDSGRAQVKKLRSIHNNTILERESEYMEQLEAPVQGDIELF
ncbi:chemotaxis protein CheD [Kineobactrum sediminis]|uniref:Probable chemoreceptor glutamine deamidase CheD n=1 Tax=Kineobactrum sediminis TaxID=1905677 RepID=A0A2N5Y6F3_9GAMM|nr:chemoreceptor glutamine deamidase CheD [Kineobactrum sediminis]PLW83951.1 chemotaxis protein CheD [Kineobactrum sediminis]